VDIKKEKQEKPIPPINKESQIPVVPELCLFFISDNLSIISVVKFCDPWSVIIRGKFWKENILSEEIYGKLFWKKNAFEKVRE
jgi:hypothetical protein